MSKERHLISFKLQQAVEISTKVIFLVFSHFLQVQFGQKGTMVAGEVSQLSLISLEGSCVAKTRQLPSSWLRLWEPAQKPKMHFTHYKPMHGLCLSQFLSSSLLSPPFSRFLSSSFTLKDTARSHQTVLDFLTFTPWLNYNLWFCSRLFSSIYMLLQPNQFHVHIHR